MGWTSSTPAGLVFLPLKFSGARPGATAALVLSCFRIRVSSVGKPHHARELPRTIGLPLHDTKQLGTQALGRLLLGTLLHRVKVSPFVSQIACHLDVADVRHIFLYRDGRRFG